MTRRVAAFGLALSLMFSTPWSARADDPDLAAGVRQAQEGDFDAALVTLGGVVRRLSGQKDRSTDLARAYTYMAVAHFGLNQEPEAKARFLEALSADPGMALTSREFPPKILKFFEDVRKQASPPAPAPPAVPPAAARTEGAPAAAGSSGGATAEVKKKGGGGKVLLLVGGGVAVAAGVGVAAGGGGSSTPAPTTTQPPCSQSPDFDFTADFAFSGTVACAASNPRIQTYRITNRSCAAVTVQSLTLTFERGGACTSVVPTRNLALNGTTTAAGATTGTPVTVVIRTGAAPGTAHLLCCSTPPCKRGICIQNETYTVSTSAGAKSLTNGVSVVDNTGRDCVRCTGAVGPWFLPPPDGQEGMAVCTGESY